MESEDIPCIFDGFPLPSGRSFGCPTTRCATRNPSFFPHVRVQTIPEADIRRIDARGASFVNISSAADLSDAEAAPAGFGPERGGGASEQHGA
jgi:hypothetical protein